MLSTVKYMTGSINVDPVAGTTYSVDGGAYTAAISYNLAPGTHSITAESAAGCISAATVVTINPQPELPATTISYNGPFKATGTVEATLAGQQGGSFSSTDGLSINAGTGVINLAASTPGSYTVTYTFGNGSCTASTTTQVLISGFVTDLSVVKAASTLSPMVGENMTFTISAANHGPDNATNVSVKELLAAGYHYVSATSTAGTYNPAAGVWNIGNLANNTSETLTITAMVKETGPYANTASVAGTEADPSSGDNTSTVTPVPIQATAALSLVKTVTNTGTGTNGAFKADDEIQYQFVITNTGGVALTDIVIKDPMISNQDINITGTLAPGTTATNDEATVTPLEHILPTAVDNTELTDAGGILTIDLVGNDMPGSLPIDPSSIQIVEHPSHGTVKINTDGTVTYTPDKGYTGTDIFTYRVKDSGGNWSNVASIAIKLNKVTLNIPNLFTPNGDGLNDVFEIRGLEAFAENEMVIVNRWGNEVFRQSNYQNNWTGQGLNEGTYYYILRVKETTGSQWKVYKGYITLIKSFKK